MRCHGWFARRAWALQQAAPIALTTPAASWRYLGGLHVKGRMRNAGERAAQRGNRAVPLMSASLPAYRPPLCRHSNRRQCKTQRQLKLTMGDLEADGGVEEATAAAGAREEQQRLG